MLLSSALFTADSLPLIVNGTEHFSMEQRTLKNVNNCLNTNTHSYLETSGGQSSSVYLNVVHFFNTSAN